MVDEEAGELYFFLQPRQSAGQSIQLAKVFGVCIVDSAQCPPLQIVNVPFAFNFTIYALNWSPDGKYAAFSYSDNPGGTPAKLWLFDAAAATWTSLAEFAYIDPPFWSPDGAWIAFLVRDRLGAEDVYVIHSDGSGLRKVGADLPIAERPYGMDGWLSADNIMLRSVLTENRVHLVNINDGLSRPMFAAPTVNKIFVAAPDASLLAYDAFESNSPAHALQVMAPDGLSGFTLASFTSGSRLYPIVWSQDSSQLAFTYYTDISSGSVSAEVYVVNRDGSNLSQVYKGATIGRLIFSPNGKYLLVEETTSATGGHLFLVKLATRESKILQAPGLTTDYDWYAPSWRP
jgi:dipeptidyl aminopeptidase/acylaminoacyl peptidase